MVFVIKFVCEEAEGFVREISIDSEATFFDLHRMVLASCGYSEGQMNSFFICDNDWERQQEITLEDMSLDPSQDSYVMDETRLSEFIEDKGQKMEYIFDTFAGRSFFLNVKEVRLGESLALPQVSRSVCDAPEEIHIEVEEPTPAKRTKKGAELADDDFGFDDFSSYSSYNDDELDLESFEISDGEY